MQERVQGTKFLAGDWGSAPIVTPELYTPLWITSSVVLGISKSFQQPKSLLTARFLGLIQVVHRSTTPSAEHIYCYYPMEV